MSYVITISRQFGSMGRSIAQELSKELCIEFLDRDIVEETSKRMGLPVSMISDEEEAHKAKFFKRAYPLGIGIPSLKNDIFEVQKNIIRDFAGQDSCIIVGRCAEYVLSDFANKLSVYIYASPEKRLENCINKLEMDEKTARRTMREVDLARENYHKTYIPNYTSPFDGKDICINSGVFGIEGTSQIISDTVRRMFLENS